MSLMCARFCVVASAVALAMCPRVAEAQEFDVLPPFSGDCAIAIQLPPRADIGDLTLAVDGQTVPIGDVPLAPLLVGLNSPLTAGETVSAGLGAKKIEKKVALDPDTSVRAPKDCRQEGSLRPIIPFLEGTDVFVSNEPKLRFESAIFPHLVVWQNFDTVLDARRKSSDKHYFWAFSGTPAVRTRMFNETSAPVRTPSYMPRGNVQMIYSADYRCGAAGHELLKSGKSGECDTSKPNSRPTVSLWELHGIIGHHSNGQTQCLFKEQSRAEEGAPCLPSYAAAAIPGTVNKQDGSFSTNYVRGGFNFRRNYLSRLDGGASDTVREWSVGAEYQRQFNTDPEVKPFYSANRFIASLSAAQAALTGSALYPCKARLDESGGVTVALDHPTDRVPRLAAWGQLTCYPNVRGGWGFFVRVYSGQDYYNLGFLDNVRRIHIGMTFNQNGFFRFRPPAVSSQSTTR